MPIGKKFRILSLDGGGSWALIQAKALQKLFGDIPGRDILSNFDLAAATSGGAIVLGGLIENKTPAQLIDLFKDKKTRESIFCEVGWLDHFLDKVLEAILRMGPRYSAAHKYSGLSKLFAGFGGTPLDEVSARAWPGSGDNKLRLLITAFDYDRKKAVFFRSDMRSLAANFETGRPPLLAEAVHASSNAPVNYFDMPALFPASPSYANRRFWDGAIGGYNNPLLAAVTEALSNPDWYQGDPRSIQALSLGTGQVSLPLGDLRPPQYPELIRHQGSTGLVKDMVELAQSIIDDPPDSASFTAHVALGQPLPTKEGQVIANGCIVRLSPVVRPVLNQASGGWSLPGWHKEDPPLSIKEFEALTKLDMDAVKKEQVELLEKLADLWLEGIVPNQGIRNDTDFNPRIGHATFGEGKAAWNNLMGA